MSVLRTIHTSAYYISAQRPRVRRGPHKYMPSPVNLSVTKSK